MKLGFRSPLADSHHVRNLLVAVSLHFVEDEDLAGTAGETLEGGLEIYREPRCHPTSSNPIQQLSPWNVPLRPLPQGLPPGENQVDSQSVEPGAEPGLTPERPQLLPGPDEDLLCEVFRPFTPGHPHGERIDLTDVAPVQSLEGPLVASGGQSHILPILIRALSHDMLDDRASESFDALNLL